MPRLSQSSRLRFASAPALCQHAQERSSRHYLFAWTGDVEHKGDDFLAVIDADPSSSSYGHLITTLATDQQTKRVHHTEYSMPASGMLFANDHDAGRTFIFDCVTRSLPGSQPPSQTWPAICIRTPTCACRTDMCWPRFNTRTTA